MWHDTSHTVRHITSLTTRISISSRRYPTFDPTMKSIVNKTPPRYSPPQRNRNTRHYSSTVKRNVSHSQYSKHLDIHNLIQRQSTATTQQHKESLNEKSSSNDPKAVHTRYPWIRDRCDQQQYHNIHKKGATLMQTTLQKITYVLHTNRWCHDLCITRFKRKPKIQYFQRKCIEGI